jgi:hypothetical protein
MKIAMDEPIVEEATIPAKPTQLRSWLCVFRLHQRTRWSEPFERRVAVPVFAMMAGGEMKTLMQYRECVGCGERDERVVIHG